MQDAIRNIPKQLCSYVGCTVGFVEIDGSGVKGGCNKFCLEKIIVGTWDGIKFTHDLKANYLDHMWAIHLEEMKV